LSDVRDLRVHSSPNYDERPPSADHLEPSRRHMSRDSPRRRRR
jgi:hypothetical protein